MDWWELSRRSSWKCQWDEQTDRNRKKARENVMCGCEVTTLRCPRTPRQVSWDSSSTSCLRSPSCCPRPPSSPLCCVCCWTPPQSPNCPNCQSSSLQNYLPRSSCHCWEISWLLKKYYCQRSPRSPLRHPDWSCPDTPGWDPCSGSSLQWSYHQWKQSQSVQYCNEALRLEPGNHLVAALTHLLLFPWRG